MSQPKAMRIRINSACQSPIFTTHRLYPLKGANVEKVKACVREFPDQEMDGILTLGVKQGQYGVSVNNQLKILHCDVSKKLFTKLNYMIVINFKVNDGSWNDFYFLGADEQGFIFQSNP